MNDLAKIHAGRLSVIAVSALLLAATACGTTRTTAITPVEGGGPQQGSVSGSTASGQTGQNLMADDRYGVATRAADPGTARASDRTICAGAELYPCLER
jgi:hypothetical protein